MILVSASQFASLISAFGVGNTNGYTVTSVAYTGSVDVKKLQATITGGNPNISFEIVEGAVAVASLAALFPPGTLIQQVVDIG